MEIIYPFHWKLRPALLEIKARLSIFIIIGACAGLPALAWSVNHLTGHRRNGHRTSVFIILLLLTDIVEILWSPYILAKLFFSELYWNIDWACWVSVSLWSSSRVCGLLLNQLVALEGILSVKYPLYTASVFSSRCFIFFYALVLVFIFAGEIFLYEEYYFFFVVFMLLVSVITWIISCGASCSADRRSQSRNPDLHIFVILLFTLLIFLPFLLILFFVYMFNLNELHPVFHIPWLLMSLRLISDPLLCVLVFRQNLTHTTLVQSDELKMFRGQV